MVNGKSKKFAFHLMPSGILTGCINILGDDVVMDPVSFETEEIAQILTADIPEILEHFQKES